MNLYTSLWVSCYMLTIYVYYVKGEYSNRWGVEIKGDSNKAKRIAQEHGFIYVNEIMPNHFLFEHPKVHRRSISHSKHRHTSLSEHSEVVWLEQQVIKKRSKRDFLPLQEPVEHIPRPTGSRRRRRSGSEVKGYIINNGSSSAMARRRSRRRSRRTRNSNIRITDPLWNNMWYLNDQKGSDMNVQAAWARGYTGKGVVVSILDDGIEKDHPDLELNYDPNASTDINEGDSDPQPRYDYSNENRHGTRCAGEVSAEANNDVCGVGIAYHASIGGVRMLDGDVTDAVEAASLSLNPNHIDIYSASWGPDDDGKTVDGPAKMAKEAFINGITKGRNGKGSIFVWASGNGGKDFDNCNCDGYTGSIFTVSISSATQHGNVPWYSESCSSTLATTYSSGHGGEKKVITTDLEKKCTETHTGTSASAPMAAGVLALTLEANSYLTWRDLQHIIVRTSKPRKLQSDDWIVNGVGRKVSHSFGYGLLDADAMVVEALNWTNVPKQSICSIPYRGKAWFIERNKRLVVNITTNGCHGSYQIVNYLEHVQAIISLKTGFRGDVQLILVSPAGTRSKLLAKRKYDYNKDGLNDWPFMTTHSWGERASGQWQLEVISGDYETEVSKCELGEYFSPVESRCVRYCPDHYFRMYNGSTSVKTTPSTGTPTFKCGSCSSNCLLCSGSSFKDCYRCTSGYLKSSSADGCIAADRTLTAKALVGNSSRSWPLFFIVVSVAVLLFGVLFAASYACGQSKVKGDFEKIPTNKKTNKVHQYKIRTPCLYNSKPATSYIKDLAREDNENLLSGDSD